MSSLEASQKVANEATGLPFEASASSILGPCRNQRIFDQMHMMDAVRIYGAWLKHMEEKEPAFYAQMKSNGEGEDGLGAVFSRSIDGAFDYLMAVRRHGPIQAMPSKAADIVWQCMAEKRPEIYEKYCDYIFGSVLERPKDGPLSGPIYEQYWDESLLRTWCANFRQINQTPTTTEVPPLFTLDLDVGIPGGYAYRSEAGHIVHNRVMGVGAIDPSAAVAHVGIHPNEMCRLGLVSRDELSQMVFPVGDNPYIKLGVAKATTYRETGILPEDASATSVVGERRNGHIFDRMPLIDALKLYTAWESHLKAEEPVFYDRLKAKGEKPNGLIDTFGKSFDGLIDYFAAVGNNNEATLLPSKAADLVWHAWLEREPAMYDRFCSTHFGFPIRHIANEDLPRPLTSEERDDRLARTWCSVFRHMEISPTTMAVPPLFSLDKDVGVPGGFAYRSNAGHISHSPVNADGKVDPDKITPHPGIHPERMAEMDLISAHESARALRPMNMNPIRRWASIGFGSVSDAREAIARTNGRHRPKPSPPASDSSGGGCGGSSCGGSCGCGGG